MKSEIEFKNVMSRNNEILKFSCKNMQNDMFSMCKPCVILNN